MPFSHEASFSMYIELIFFSFEGVDKNKKSLECRERESFKDKNKKSF